MTLNVEPNIPDQDSFYDALLAAHQGLDEAESHALNARLILLLANHVGHRDTLDEALGIARQSAKTA